MSSNKLDLEKEVKKGNLDKAVSNDGNLEIYNYSNSINYNGKWSPLLERNRGTIYEKESGKLIAKSFDRFPNFNMIEDEELKYDLMNSKKFNIYEKLDGSLGIIFFYNGIWNVATRKSFSSEQAIYARKNLLKKYDFSKLDKDITLSAEIIYPENKHTINYGDAECLVLLAAFKGEEEILDLDKVKVNIPRAKKYQFLTINEALDKGVKLKNKEGYVFQNEKGQRMKIKSIDYFNKVRKDITSSKFRFWQNMDEKTGEINRDFVENLPEELKEENEIFIRKLKEEFLNEKKRIIENYHNFCKKYIYPNPNKVKFKDVISFFKTHDWENDKKLEVILAAKGQVRKLAYKNIKPDRNDKDNIVKALSSGKDSDFVDIKDCIEPYKRGKEKEIKL